ncbi:hypothetical protein GYMLUDRAFT_257424 [Collybiopsis luxurians FD-317 M1]|nr:hypothetical protein GYMLUDRAFT_257424 [Collybiopsis luxurians FD-317 M1]
MTDYSPLIEEWLLRTGALPLNLEIVYCGMGEFWAPYDPFTDLPPDLYILLPFLPRAKCLTIHLVCSSTIFAFLHHIATNLRTLESLKLELEVGEPFEYPIPSEPFIFLASANLKNLTLIFDSRYLPSWLAFPLSKQLQSFSLENNADALVDEEALQDMLSKFPNLIEYKLRCPPAVPVDMNNLTIKYITLPSLQTLEVHFAHDGSLPAGMLASCSLSLIAPAPFSPGSIYIAYRNSATKSPNSCNHLFRVIPTPFKPSDSSAQPPRYLVSTLHAFCDFVTIRKYDILELHRDLGASLMLLFC